jgi:HEAT repeat protein
VRSVEYHARELRKTCSLTEANKQIRALVGIGTPKALRALARHGLNHFESNIAMAATSALSNAGGDEHVDNIVKAWLKQPGYTKKYTTIALGRMGTEKAVKALIEHGLTSSLESVVVESAEALGRTGNTRALPHLMMLADHKDDYVRDAAKKAIRGIQKLEKLRKSDELEWHARFLIEEFGAAKTRQHIRALERMGTEKAVELIIEHGLKPPARHPMESIRALKRIGTEQAIRGLIHSGLGEHVDSDAKEFARKTLMSFGKKATTMLAKEGMHSRDSNVVTESINLLGRMTDRKTIAALQKIADKDVLFNEDSREIERLLGKLRAHAYRLREKYE